MSEEEAYMNDEVPKHLVRKLIMRHEFESTVHCGVGQKNKLVGIILQRDNHDQKFTVHIGIKGLDNRYTRLGFWYMSTARKMSLAEWRLEIEWGYVNYLVR